MTTKGQRTGMRGVYLVAAELVARGLIVSPTSRSAFGADLLVTDDSCAHAYSVQVKTNGRPAGFWLVGEKAQHLVARSHVYVFVNIHPDDGEHEYYVVPSRIVAKHTTAKRQGRGDVWYAFRKEHARRYRDRWAFFGV